MATPQEIILTQDFEQIQKLFKRPQFNIEQETAIKQYNVETHDVFDESIRPKRLVLRDTGRKDDNGQPIQQQVMVEVVRVGIPWQKIITERRVGFMLSDPVKTVAIYAGDKPTDKEKQLVKMVEKIQDDNKMDYKNKEILRRKLSEMEVAVIWYYAPSNDPNYKFTLNSKILSPVLGDTLYPLFDSVGNMVAFRRDYKLNNGVKDIAHSDIYTPEFEYKYIDLGGKMELDPEATGLNAKGVEAVMNPIPNVALKLLIEYYCQPQTVWNDVQNMTKRHEEVTSNHGGMNDKFGAPILAVAGKVTSIETSNTTGTLLQLENEATANYLNLSSEPQSIKLEQDNLHKYIFMMSQTPDISFEAMSGMGTIAQFTMKAFFMDAHMAVRKEEETFGIGLQRRLNIIKHAIGALIDTSLAKEAATITLKPVISPYLPANITEMIENLSVAKTGGIISTETAVEQNPLVPDSVAEMVRIGTDNQNNNAGL
jgi:SPP1 family phage portal protein